MVGPNIVDRRLNPPDKSLGNRRRFLDRFRERIKDAARKQISDRGITDSGNQEITIGSDGIEEPHFTQDPKAGDWDYVLPGNRDYLPGDSIAKPKSGSGGRGRSGGKGQSGEDEFQFLLSYDEYLDLIFDDLMLPDLIKKSEKTLVQHQLRRAGFTTSGNPSTLNVERTAMAGIGRRIALRGSRNQEIIDLEQEIAKCEDETLLTELNDKLAELLAAQNRRISWLDTVDLRYNNFVPQPKPITQAVMFCIMDVSFSMGEREKTIAKKFFLLLHLFLKRTYKHIDVVFVRHHETAEECDETMFFTSKISGGTIVSSALECIQKIITDRYSTDAWNVYCAQASDGDNYPTDSDVVHEYMHQLMPICQMWAYIEISREQSEMMFSYNTSLWGTLSELQNQYSHLSMQQIAYESDVINVFRKFFARSKA